MLVAVDAPHFYAGIVLERGVVVRAAPILRWTIGKTDPEMRAYFHNKGWKAVIVCD